MNEVEHNFDRQTDRGIQLLRIMACFAVFICHFGQRMNLADYSITAFNVSNIGKYGVELFFVISGYLVCFSLCKGTSVIAFYKKRIIRIFPLYYFCILYFFITETFFFKEVPVDPQSLGWLRYIFCLNGIVPSDGYFWGNIGITWTIPVFMFFYLLAPLLVKISKSVFFSVLVLVSSIGLAYITNRFFFGWLSALIYLPCFIFGIIVYNAKKEKKQFVCVVVLLLITFVFKWASIENIISDIVQDVYVLSSLFAAMILLSEYFVVKNKRITIFLNALDEYSYTLYLVHGIVFCSFIDKYEISIIPRAMVAIFGTMMLTWTVHRFIEKPIQKLLKKALFKSLNNC